MPAPMTPSPITATRTAGRSSPCIDLSSRLVTARGPASSALVPYHAAESVVDVAQQVIGQRDAGGTDVLVHLLGPRGARDGRADVGLAQHPRQRQLRQWIAGLSGQALQA